jgi:UDP-2,3-diacylglucosamine pyrophosphatase LpxH
MYIKIKLICGHVHRKLPQNTAVALQIFINLQSLQESGYLPGVF